MTREHWSFGCSLIRVRPRDDLQPGWGHSVEFDIPDRGLFFAADSPRELGEKLGPVTSLGSRTRKDTLWVWGFDEAGQPIPPELHQGVPRSFKGELRTLIRSRHGDRWLLWPLPIGLVLLVVMQLGRRLGLSSKQRPPG